MWLRLIRWKNLLIILLTQLLAWTCVLVPQQHRQPGYLLTAPLFLCLTLSTILIAAAGYIINDYFDVSIDLINRPGKVVLGNGIPRKAAIIAHALFNIIAVVLALYVARKAHHYEWLLLQFTCIALLWFYSTLFKRQYIIGNVVVALLTALTILVLVVYEPTLHTLSLPLSVLGVYAFFAFMLTWMREIVKDMEDYHGDAAEGCVTMPIRRGLRYAARFTVALSTVTLSALTLSALMLIEHHYYLLALYIALMLAVPLIAWTVAFPRRHHTDHYRKASRWLKLIMVAGICSLLIYYFQLLSSRV
jgi:4-hydroxybenzoate polyprenyltransferase